MFSMVFEEEREGKYLGQSIQVHPHITSKIHSILEDLGKEADIVIAEIGGTVGDYESGHFMMAIQQFRQKHPEDVLVVHVAPIIWLNIVGEFKTKPLQKSIIELQQFGIFPDILLCRADRPVPEKLLAKISEMTGVPRTSVFDAPDTSSVYEVPISFYERHIDDFIADRFHLRRTGVRIHKYKELVEKYVSSDLPTINLGIIGKYTSHTDAYLSLKEAIYHAGVSNNTKVNIKWIEADKLEECVTTRGMQKYFEGMNCVIVPGGFDNRGVEGKIKAIQYARERKIPFLGICLGLQCAVIEFARNVCGIKDANSVEFKKDDQDVITPVVHFVPGLEHIRRKGGTLRLGSYECSVVKDSLASEVYGKKVINERHRHRYEVNNEYANVFQEHGLVVSGVNTQSGLIEIMELDRKLHPYFIMGQFHPEFKSRLTNPHPLFDKLVHHAIHTKAE